MGAYAPTYNGADMGPIFIDALGAIGVVFVSLASIVGLVLIYNWVKSR